MEYWGFVGLLLAIDGSWEGGIRKREGRYFVTLPVFCEDPLWQCRLCGECLPRVAGVFFKVGDPVIRTVSSFAKKPRQ